MSFSLVDKWVLKVVTKFIQVGAVLTKIGQKEERLSKCEGCPYNTKKKVSSKLPEVQACSACNCILPTKAEMISNMRLKSKVENEEPLDEEEVVYYNTWRLLRPEEFIQVDIKCEHPDGNQWEEIDKKYLNR